MKIPIGLMLLGLVLVPQARADALGDLKARLKTLEADTGIKGVLEARYESFDDKGAPDPSKSAQLQMDIEANGGLSIHFSPALVQALADEEGKNSADPDKPVPLADLQREMSPSHLRHMLSAADTLLVLMDGATSPVTKPSTLDGAEVTALSMDLPVKAPKKQLDNLKDWQDTLTVWMDTDGVPLKIEDKAHGKFCKFFFCFTFDEDHFAEFKVVNGRLVAVREDVERRQSGLGQDSHTKTTATLELQ
ncbi:MAG: hypothetical protein ACM3ZT_08340 [Bacillota bacterium]